MIYISSVLLKGEFNRCIQVYIISSKSLFYKNKIMLYTCDYVCAKWHNCLLFNSIVVIGSNSNVISSKSHTMTNTE